MYIYNAIYPVSPCSLHFFFVFSYVAMRGTVHNSRFEGEKQDPTSPALENKCYTFEFA